jgi:hypothetical protein
VQTTGRVSMRRALTAKVIRSPGRGHCPPAGRQTFPRYVAVGNAKRVASRVPLIEGQVYADFDADGNLIGVEILG